MSFSGLNDPWRAGKANRRENPPHLVALISPQSAPTAVLACPHPCSPELTRSGSAEVLCHPIIYLFSLLLERFWLNPNSPSSSSTCRCFDTIRIRQLLLEKMQSTAKLSTTPDPLVLSSCSIRRTWTSKWI